MFGDDQRKSYCQHCKKNTFQVLQSYKVISKNTEAWICQECGRVVEIIKEKP